MKLSLLKNLDPSIEIIFELNPNCEIKSITDTQVLDNECLLFIKNKKFLNEFNEKNQKHSKLFLMIEKSFFDQIDSTLIENMKSSHCAILTCKDVNASMSFLSKAFYDKKFANINDAVDGRQMGTASVHPTAFISQNVFIGENVKVHPMVKIHPGVVIMSGAEIGEGSEIYPNSTIYRNVIIGKNVRIHSGCTIGADGFGYNFVGGAHQKVWHMGSVVVGDNVEIGANSCVDAGTFSPTIIGDGTKIDNLCQIGHNVRVGKHVVLCADIALAGSCTLEDYVVMGGMSAVGNGIHVGMAAQIAAMAGVTSNVEAKAVVGGFPARDIKEWMRGNAMLRKISLSKSKES